MKQTKPISMRVTREDYDEIAEEAEEQNRSISNYLLNLHKEHIRKQG